MASNPCGVNGALHSAPDKTQLIASGDVSVMRNIFPTDTDEVTIEKTSGTGKEKKVEKFIRKVKEAVREFVIACNEEKSAKEKKDDAANAIREYVKKIRDGNAYTGDYQKTYRVCGIVAKSGQQYGASSAHVDRCTCPKKETDIAAIKKLVGTKFFNEHFERELTIAIKKEVLENKDLRKELTILLLKHFGVEGIKKYFVKEEVWTIKIGMDKAQYELKNEVRQELLTLIKFYADKVDDATFDPKNTL
jgi:hypothetical protein